jgi:hypothetical protein
MQKVEHLGVDLCAHWNRFGQRIQSAGRAALDVQPFRLGIRHDNRLSVIAEAYRHAAWVNLIQVRAIRPIPAPIRDPAAQCAEPDFVADSAW